MNQQADRMASYLEARRTTSDTVRLSGWLLAFGVVFTAICTCTLVLILNGKPGGHLAEQASAHASNVVNSSEASATEHGQPKRVVLLEVPAEFKTIQAAIHAAPTTDAVIRVAPGIYTESLSFEGKNIVLTSHDPKNPQVVKSTVIDGNRAEYVVNLEQTNTRQTVLTGFCITNGSTGGIRANGSMATISYNDITGNHGNSWVCGIRDANGAVENNNIFQNRGTDTGVGIRHCNGEIRGNRIFENYGGKYSYGIRDSHGMIVANQIYDNYRFPGLDDSPSGRGIFYCNGTIANNRIYNNSGTNYGYGIKDCSGLIEGNVITSNRGGIAGRGVSGCSGTIRLNTLEGNSHYGIDNCTTAVISDNKFS
ncbi:MAG: right-handed parallel beta-helix repeat-containing protein [Candidatus Hydrogenedentes bacterium]|nr:right-handed parallel beta-helix repeat-containing protein [Candidatus Hydrogenedentota bacterium]